jgi:hypothetical protein
MMSRDNRVRDGGAGGGQRLRTRWPSGRTAEQEQSRPTGDLCCGHPANRRTRGRQDAPAGWVWVWAPGLVLFGELSKPVRQTPTGARPRNRRRSRRTNGPR